MHAVEIEMYYSHEPISCKRTGGQIKSHANDPVCPYTLKIAECIGG
jgi:hypothetical protein